MSMKLSSCFRNKLQHVFSCSCFKLSCFFKSTCFLISCLYQYTALHLNLLSIQLLYFLSVSILGFWVLKVLKPRTDPSISFRPRSLDLLFTSVSAITVSSMSTVEMEVFSNSQLIVLTILMFTGGEVFTSMVGLHLRTFNLGKIKNKVIGSFTGCNISNFSSSPSNILNETELGMATDKSKPETNELGQIHIESADVENLKYKSIKFLSFVVLGYLVLIHIMGVGFLLLYLTIVSSARDVLKSKGLQLFTFSVFTIVSTFSNCGFVPTNENMIVFSKNSGFLLILLPQILLGNTLFPSFLRFSIWVLGKFVKRVESDTNYLLKNSKEIGYHHLLPSLHSVLLIATAVGFILIQSMLFWSMEWNSAALSGLDSFEKVVGVFFQTTNARNAGENIVDLTTISPAIVVLFILMMYLPPYTTFLPTENDEQCPQECKRKKKKREKVVENLILSRLSYLVIFIILICITERKKMKEDPLNFSVLNIVVEVISAYGNVGFSMGYSCERQLKPNSSCEDKWYGFAGKWSDEGKIILIIIMFFGRLKKFNMHGGRAWKLL